MIEPLMTVKEVADTFKVSRNTVYEWANTGVLPSVKVGGTRRFREQDVRDLIEKG